MQEQTDVGELVLVGPGFAWKCGMKGNCCNTPIVITPAEYKSHLYKHFPFQVYKREDGEMGFAIIPFTEESQERCRYNVDGKCEIYDDRPLACRLFPFQRVDGKEFFNKRCSCCAKTNTLEFNFHEFDRNWERWEIGKKVGHSIVSAVYEEHWRDFESLGGTKEIEYFDYSGECVAIKANDPLVTHDISLIERQMLEMLAVRDSRWKRREQ